MSESERSQEQSGHERLVNVVSEALSTSKDESQSLVAPPVTAPVEGRPHKLGFAVGNRSDEEMAALDTCGMYGGWDASHNHPCQRPSSFGILNAQYGITAGKCFQHTDERMEALALKKAEFLERFMDQPANLIDICNAMGIRKSQPYLWKLTDVGFRRTFEALVIIVDAVRHHIAEDAMFDRIRDVEAGADTLRMFYFQNRSGGRWRDVRKDAPQAPSSTIIQAGGDVTVNNVKVWQIGDDFVSF